jgi:hypothetical protein
LTDGVAGCNAPSEEEIRSIVVSGGGTWIDGAKELLELLRVKDTAPPSAAATSSASSSDSGRGKKRRLEDISEMQDGEGGDGGGLVIISSDTALPSVSKEIRAALQSAVDSDLLSGGGVHTIEVLFLGVLRQRLMFSETDLVKSSPTRTLTTDRAPPTLEKKKPTAKSKKVK